MPLNASAIAVCSTGSRPTNAEKTMMLLLILLVAIFAVSEPSQRRSRATEPDTAAAGTEPPNASRALRLPVLRTRAGDLSKAFDVAVSAFKVEALIPPEKKNLDNYKIELRR